MITDREGSHYNAVFFISEHIKIHTVNIRPEHFVKILFWCNYDELNAARVLILTGPCNDRRFRSNISSNLRRYKYSVLFLYWQRTTQTFLKECLECLLMRLLKLSIFCSQVKHLYLNWKKSHRIFGGKLPQSNCLRNRIEELNSIYFCKNRNEFPITRHCLTQQGYFNGIFTWSLIVCYFKSATIVATQCYQWNSKK